MSIDLILQLCLISLLLMAKQGKKVRNKSSKAITGSLKDLDQKRKQVFKPVLDNPFTQSNLWPFIKPELAEQIIQLLELILAPIGNYYKLASARNQAVRSRNRCKTTSPSQLP